MGTIRPFLLALAVLLVVDPVALVFGSVSVSVLAETMRFVVLPLPIVDVSVGMDQSSSTIGFVSLPVPLVNAAVGPNLIAFAVFVLGSYIPLALVTSSILQSHHGSLFLHDPWLILFVSGTNAILEWRQAVSNLHHSGSLLL